MAKPFCVPIWSGIGNVIQTLPFAFEMKRRYGRVAAYNKGLDFKQTKEMVAGVFDQIYPSKGSVPTNQYIIGKTGREPYFPEYKSWFKINNEKLPDKFKIDFIGYTDVPEKHSVVIWPECKDNWPCKQWMYWEQLAERFKDVALVGLKKTSGFKNAIDYRGRLSLMKTGGLIRNAKIFIGNEGGISHYAAALGIKTFIILGCTDPKKNLPPNNAIPVSKNLSCQPCQFKKILKKKSGKTYIFYGCAHRNCLQTLTVDNVLEVINDHANNVSL